MISLNRFFIILNIFCVGNAYSTAHQGIAGTQIRETSFNSANDVFAKDKRPVVLFDGVCNFCNTWVNAALELDSEGKALRYTPLQSKIGQLLLERTGRSSDDISSIVLITERNAYIKGDAILHISERLGGVAPLLTRPARLMPHIFRDRIYDIVAQNRYNFMGKRDTCRCSDAKYADRFIY